MTFLGSFLAPFTSFSEYETFYRRVLSSPAVMKYCYHGGRIIQWLPYQGWDDINGEVNVTYFKSTQPLLMHNAWRKNNPNTPTGASTNPKNLDLNKNLNQIKIEIEIGN